MIHQLLYQEARIHVLALAPKREHVITWSDAAGANRKIAAFMWSERCGWYYTMWRMPKSVWKRLLPRNDDQIGFQELAGAVIALTTFMPWLENQAWTSWVDNQGVLGALIKGGCRAYDTNAVIGQVWLVVAEKRIAMQLGRVASLSNIADEPTRDSDDWATRVQARFLKPVISDWLADPWLAPDCPPHRFNRWL